MKPKWELYLSFSSCSFFSAQSSLVSLLWCILGTYTTFCRCRRLGHLVSGRWRCLCLFCQSQCRRQCFIPWCLFEVWLYSVPLLVGGSHVIPCISRILYRPHSTCASGLKAEGKCHRGSDASFISVEDFRIENISSLHMPWWMAIRGSCRTGQ